MKAGKSLALKGYNYEWMKERLLLKPKDSVKIVSRYRVFMIIYVKNEDTYVRQRNETKKERASS